MPEAASVLRRPTSRLKREADEASASWYLDQILSTAEPIALSEGGDVFVMLTLRPEVMDHLSAFRASNDDDEPDDPDEDGHDAEDDGSDREPSIGWPEDFLAVYQCSELDAEQNEVPA